MQKPKWQNERNKMFDARVESEQQQKDFIPFEFTDMDGAVHTLMNSSLLTGEQITRLLNGDDSILRNLNEGAYEAIQKMGIGVGEKLAEAWIEHGGTTGKEQSESSETESEKKDSPQT